MLAAQGNLTYCVNRTLTYHLYADGSGLLVLTSLLTSARGVKNKFFDRLTVGAAIPVVIFRKFREIYK